MHKQRIYLDTSVIGGCFDIEFAEWSNKLIDEFIVGKRLAVVSEIVFKEINAAPPRVINRLNDIPVDDLMIVDINNEIESLADEYLKANIITDKYYDDALHIACATFYNVDILVSWNFKHIVNYNRIIKYNSINLLNGFKTLEIRNPKEVISDEEGI